MLKISHEQIEILLAIKERFLKKTKVSVKSNWISLSNNDIWLYMVEQIIAVGSSKPSTKFHEDADLRSQISLNSLGEIRDKKRILERINHVLRAVGSRYASSDVSRCKKTQALAFNFEIIEAIPGSLKGLLEEISEIQGPDVEKAKSLMKRFKFFGSKNARDLLMEMGICRDVIAFDVRIKNILRRVGIELPSRFESNPKLYDEVEREILEKICKPLGISGVYLDRMLYQNYPDIIDWIWKVRFGFFLLTS